MRQQKGVTKMQTQQLNTTIVCSYNHQRYSFGSTLNYHRKGTYMNQMNLIMEGLQCL